MNELYKIKNYTMLSSPREISRHIHYYENCEDDSGETVEILVLEDTEKNHRLISRLFENEIKPLTGMGIPGFVKTIDLGFDNGQGIFFIVYEHFSDQILEEGSTLIDVSTVIEIVKGLDFFKKNGNNQNFIISPKYIKIDNEHRAKLLFPKLYEVFSQEDALEKDYLPALPGNLRPNFQDDIYSLIKTFESFFQENYNHNEADKNVVEQILKTALDKDRRKRFGKYHELIELLQKLPSLKKKQFPLLQVCTQQGNEDEFEDIVSSMNDDTWILIEPQKSKKNQITGRFSTPDYSGRFFYDDDGHLFIPFDLCRKSRDDRVIQNEDSFIIEAIFTTDEYDNPDWTDFFKEEFENINALAKLHTNKQNELTIWQKLPEVEKEFIEARAFKAQYEKRESSKEGLKIIFTLDEKQPGNRKIAWGEISRIKKERKRLVINDQIIGEIADWKSTSRTITIKDPICTIAEIPNQGFLSEDVHQETSQYKKQVEACQRFIKSDIANKDIGDIVATPDEEIKCGVHDLKYDEFKNKLVNPKIAKDESQLDAVLEAISYSPIYIIQGPPGTGKTTVIVETIQQIVKDNPDAKILLTSQSNLAVDNVLEKLVDSPDIKFIRLASENAVENDSILESMRSHCYEQKLKSWIGNTEKRSREYMRSAFPNEEKERNLEKIYKALSKAKSENDFRIFKKELASCSNYLQQKFENASNIEDADKILKAEFNEKYFKLKELQKDWFAFIDNSLVDSDSESKRKKAMLNNGSEEIDFLTAMLYKMNVLGATCIHIASSKYSRINFKFDYVIMDESSKATPAESLVPMCMGRKVIMIGDDKQLPPVITREDAVKKGIKEKLEDDGLDINKTYGESLFEKIKKSFECGCNSRYVKMLDIQYRMPKQLGTLISKYFYDGKLKNPDIEGYDELKHHHLNLKKDTSIIFFNTSTHDNPYDNGDKYNRQNQCNVDIIKEILAKLDSLYPHNLSEEKPYEIGIIAGYRGQVELLKNQVNTKQYSNFVKDGNSLIQINTVDRFQGAERDIIIYDIVRSNSGNDNIGFLADYRRINVAFSRAKRLLIIVGDSDFLLNKAAFTKTPDFPEFKLKQIAEELKQEGLIFNQMEEIFNG